MREPKSCLRMMDRREKTAGTSEEQERKLLGLVPQCVGLDQGARRCSRVYQVHVRSWVVCQGSLAQRVGAVGVLYLPKYGRRGQYLGRYSALRLRTSQTAQQHTPPQQSGHIDKTWLAGHRKYKILVPTNVSTSKRRSPDAPHLGPARPSHAAAGWHGGRERPKICASDS